MEANKEVKAVLQEVITANFLFYGAGIAISSILQRYVATLAQIAGYSVHPWRVGVYKDGEIVVRDDSNEIINTGKIVSPIILALMTSNAQIRETSFDTLSEAALHYEKEKEGFVPIIPESLELCDRLENGCIHASNDSQIIILTKNYNQWVVATITPIGD